ncbi:MAG: 5-formyltetrahydrofolate cyclo-ligase [Methanobacteriota archaeon]
MKKQKLRQEFLQRRKALTSVEVQQKSIQIQNRLFALDEFVHAKTVLFYVSYDNEVATHDLIKACFSLGKQVVVPCTDIEKRILVLSELRCWEDLDVGAYHILEPKPVCRQPISYEVIDLVLVPGVVFDAHGQRIGHGKAYYDRLLQKMVGSKKIGLAFEFQLVEKVPAKKHDVRVEKIVTEQRVITCSV